MAPSPEIAGFLALIALLTLPGVVVVRAPWTSVPALSVAFWALSWWWVPVDGRSRLLAVTLVFLAALALLRLVPKHFVAPPRGYPDPPLPVSGPTTGTAPRLSSLPSAVMVAVALGVVAPFVLWAHAPGPEMAFTATSARLAVWRDGLPWSYAPLLPLAPFGAPPPALATLAADLSLLSGLDPSRTLLLATLAAVGLALLGLYALLSTWLPPEAAALVASLALAAAPWPGLLAMWGEGEAMLALPLLLAAATLLIGHASRPSAVAAGVLLGAAALAQPVMTLCALGGLAASGGRTTPSRLGLAGGVAFALACPQLARTAGALSAREALLVVSAVRPREVGTFVGAAGVVTLLALLALLAARRPARRPRLRVGAAILSFSAGVVLVLRVHGWVAAGQLPLPVRSSLTRVSGQGPPVQPVCASAEVADWVPALAGRPVAVPGPGAAGPWVPPVLRDEASGGPHPSCGRSTEVVTLVPGR